MVYYRDPCQAGFLFPGEGGYHNPAFSPFDLMTLGVKSTCEDRWLQVLSEANCIEEKHLLTLGTAIVHNQTREVKERQQRAAAMLF
jgi:hypothetical protein